VRKKQLPTFPNDFIGDKADEYESSRWMERNQKKTTLLSLQYLFDEKLILDDEKDSQITESLLILDLGCGTGFSSEVLSDNGFKVIGVDLLPDMLLKARKKNMDLDFILADINFLPFRHKTVDHIISISSYNFITCGKDKYKDKVELLRNTTQYLYRILKEKGRIVIEFYPKGDLELKMFNDSFTNNGFEGYMVKNKPNQKSGQTFLILRKRMRNGNM
jgi:SAM-dependent methyltransferase